MPVKKLTHADVAQIVRLSREGFTQVELAKRFNVNQSHISNLLAEFTDTTEESKTYLRGQSLAMAKNIVKKGRAADHVAALKGLSVLQEDRGSAVTVLVGAGGTLNMGSFAMQSTPELVIDSSPLSPPALPDASERSQDS